MHAGTRNGGQDNDSERRHLQPCGKRPTRDPTEQGSLPRLTRHPSQTRNPESPTRDPTAIPASAKDTSQHRQLSRTGAREMHACTAGADSPLSKAASPTSLKAGLSFWLVTKQS